MLVRICSLLVFLVALPAFCQVEPSAEGGATANENETPMMTPPPVSGIAYPSVVGTDVTSNYFSAAVTVNAGYTDNVLIADTSTPVSESTFLINPTLSYDRVTPRQHTTFMYSPGFSFYQPDSILDSIDQTANFRFEERLSPHVAFNLTDSFMRTSDVFNVSFPFAGGIGGTTQSPGPAVLAPFAQQTSNNGGGAVSYQFGRNSMVGAGGEYTLYSFGYPNQSQGLYNSTGESAEAYYVRRFARNQYVGMDYQYSRTIVTPSTLQVDVQTETLMPFYSIYFNRNFSVSVSAGAQNSSVAQTPQPTTDSWSPSVVASMGWQTPRANVALSFLRIITVGEGLLGAYELTGVNASGAYKFSRTWRAGASLGYNTLVASQLPAGANYQGGNNLMVGLTLGYAIGDHFTVGFGYDRLRETFSGIQAITGSPNADQEYVAVTYQFRKPLGR